jgi:general secretion pathway protein C
MARRRHLILFTYLTLAAFLIAHSLNAFVAQALTKPLARQDVPITVAVPVPASSNSARLAEEILHSGLFVITGPMAAGGGTVSAMHPGAKPLDAGKKIRVMGTVVGEGLGALAVVENIQTKKQLLYHLYERIPEVGQIVEVRRDGIMIEEEGQKEFVMLFLVGAGTQAGPVSVAAVQAQGEARPFKSRYSMDRRMVTQSVADVPKLLTQAQAAPFYQDGKLAGWKIESIKTGSLYDQIGLQQGDVIQRVNGVEVKDPGMVLTLFQQLKDENTVKLDLLRNNQRTTVTYDIK